ncbi:hypothetical protein BCR35DRAFT_309008 [Leucosporidium creatinivorum]|uniref:Uncharacterized protein n=1 Tax=Leucosporidium creatinivorum TaxID=106004 RepID=A0A1Y2DRM1_9BASI|nr:hypothetical protein BCR35DRAFT_309008 [Leucosporidium creatinivorum]
MLCTRRWGGVQDEEGGTSGVSSALLRLGVVDGDARRSGEEGSGSESSGLSLGDLEVGDPVRLVGVVVPGGELGHAKGRLDELRVLGSGRKGLNEVDGVSMVSNTTIISDKSNVQRACSSFLRHGSLVLEENEIADEVSSVAGRGEEGTRWSCITNAKVGRRCSGGEGGGETGEEQSGAGEGGEGEVHG